MYFPRALVLASGCLESLLFAALSSNNLPSAITFASVDVGMRGAHLAMYVGLGRYGLKLPVGHFLPPPIPVTDTDLALYVTPVVAAVWGPSVKVADAAIKSTTKVASSLINLDSAVVRRSVDKIIRPHCRYADPLARAEPVRTPMTLQDDYSYNPYYNRSLSHLCAHNPVRSLKLSDMVPPPAWSTSPSSSFIEPPRPQPSLSPSKPPVAVPQSSVSAIIGLGQCTPYRVLPSHGEAVLETDFEGELAPKVVDYKAIMDDIILDELEEPREKTKTFVMYRPPPCTEDSCALVVYVEPSKEIFDYVLDCWALLWYCHICTAFFFIARTCCMAYRMMRWTVRVLYRALISILGLIKSMLEALMQLVLVICDSLHIFYPALEFPPSAPVPLPTPPASIVDPDLNLAPNPMPSPDAAQIIHSNYASKRIPKKRKNKKKRDTDMYASVVDPTKIPLPEDDVCRDPSEDLHSVAPPAVPNLPLVLPPGTCDHRSTANSTTAPFSLDSKPAASTLSPAPPINSASSTLIFDQATIPPLEEDDGAGWKTVVKRKPWHPFVPAPGPLAKIDPKEVGGEKEGKRKRKGRRK